jgi:tRNA (guanine37-N1)-methyltransferase
MIFNCLTIFPEMFACFTGVSLAQKAIEKGKIEVNVIDFRMYTQDKHNRVDDYPFGGGAGMLLTPQPLFDCFEDVQKKFKGKKVRNIYMSPAGCLLTRETILRLCRRYDVLNILCGHYEGVDQRVIDTYIQEELSIGDYVLTGGELPAMVLMDCVMRYVPGVLSNDASVWAESFEENLLEHPQYTRPQEFRGLNVPDILLSGHHAKIEHWKREQSIIKTYCMRPDLLERASLTIQEREMLEKIKVRG